MCKVSNLTFKRFLQTVGSCGIQMSFDNHQKPFLVALNVVSVGTCGFFGRCDDISITESPQQTLIPLAAHKSTTSNLNFTSTIKSKAHSCINSSFLLYSNTAILQQSQ